MSTPTWQNPEVLAAAAGPQGPQVQAVFAKAADIGLEQSQALRKAAELHQKFVTDNTPVEVDYDALGQTAVKLAVGAAAAAGQVLLELREDDVRLDLAEPVPAAGVAASFAQVAIGTETDGSIVCPAGANGVVGLKPTIGQVSRDGIVPISAEQDTAGHPPLHEGPDRDAVGAFVVCALGR